MGKDIDTLVREFRAIIDTCVRYVLSFQDSDLDHEFLLDYEYGRVQLTLRGIVELWWLDEFLVHTGQIAGARLNVAHRKVYGAPMEYLPPGQPTPEGLKNMTPVRPEAEGGIQGRTHISRLAGECYIAGHQLLSQFIGVDESIMEEPAKPGEWSGRQVLEHMDDADQVVQGWIQHFTSNRQPVPHYGRSAGKAIPALVSGFREAIDTRIEELLGFQDSDLAREVQIEQTSVQRTMTLRGAIEGWLDEMQVHSGQIQGARMNVAFRKLIGMELEWSEAKYTETEGTSGKLKTVNFEKQTGQCGRTHISRLAGEVYLAGHQLLSQFIGVDESFMEEPAKSGEWSGRQVLEHLVEFYGRPDWPEVLASYRGESDGAKTQ